MKRLILALLIILGTAVMVCESPAAKAAGSNSYIPGDLNDNGVVDITDLSIMLSQYGSANAISDVNGDGAVNSSDLTLLLGHWGQSELVTNVLNNPIDPSQITLTNWGKRSHWLQPWRAWLDTPTAAQYLDRLGMAWNTQTAYQASAAQKLASAGIKRVRFEEGWSNVKWDETGLSNQSNMDSLLQSFKDNGLRPIILLNANSGVPCPVQNWSANLTADAAAGARTIQVDAATAAQIVPDYSGLDSLTLYKTDEVIFKSVSGTTVTLSKPLPIALTAGKHPASTMKYRPFNSPGTPEYNATLAGWLTYVDLIKQEADKILGNGNYDVEVWNELTFGSAFLSIANYDDSYTNVTSPNSDILLQTIRHLHNEGFQGGIIDGFTNTVPWPATARTEPGYTGSSRHPYSDFYASGPPWTQSGSPLNALGLAATFEPTYYIYDMPEYYLNLFQTEGFSRYLYPGTGQNVGGTPVGPQYDGQMWLTEIRSFEPPANNPFQMDTQKEILRLYAAWAGKGAYTFPYATGSGTGDNWRLVDDSDPTGGPVIQDIKRMTGQLTVQSITNRRQIQLLRIADNHNAKIFSGDGTAGQPDLYERDAVFTQPIQSSDSQFELLTYVMTRNLTATYPGRPFSQTLCCFSPTVSVTATDPITGDDVPVTLARGNNGQLTITMTLMDYPRVVTVKENP